jgi:peroxiredoxin
MSLCKYPHFARFVLPVKHRRRLALSVAALAILVSSAAIAAPTFEDDRPAEFPPPDKKVVEIAERVRANEARYRNLEIVFKTTGSARSTLGGNVTFTLESISRAVYDGERFYFHLTKSTVAVGHQTARTEVLAAFDGEKTRSVESGNSVNIYSGRREPPQMVPPHSWVLVGCRVNFALSSLLLGTEGLRNDPKTPEYTSGLAGDFYQVGCDFDGEEVIDGLRCFRIRCYEDRRIRGKSYTQFWIAPDRNYFCVKLRATYEDDLTDDTHPWLESSVKEWKKISADQWLPARIATQEWRLDGQTTKWISVREETQRLDSAIVNAKHDARLFRETPFPTDVPVFAIDDNQLVDDVDKITRPAANADSALRRVIRRLRDEEKKYSNLDVRTHATRRSLDDASSYPFMGGAGWNQADNSHYIVSDRPYFETSVHNEGAVGTHRNLKHVQAYDGKWTRGVNKADAPDSPEKANVGTSKLQQQPNLFGNNSSGMILYASLTLGAADHVTLFRPHTLLMGFPLCSYTGNGSLFELLSTGIWYRGMEHLEVAYVGEDRRDGLECDVIQIGQEHLATFDYLWLARDRNLIPVRIEQHSKQANRSLPVAFAQVTEMREVQKGVWLPFKIRQLGSDLNYWTRNRVGRVLFDWRRDLSIDSVSLSPTSPQDTEAKLSVPQGTELTVTIPGKDSLRVRQAATGIVSVAPAAWRDARIERIVRFSNWAGRKPVRNKNIDALIGTPPPPLPDDKWVNGSPLNWQDLNGRVVVLHFFAASVRLCEPDLNRLSRESERLAKEGIIVVGIHPPSNVDTVKQLVSKFHLKYPIAIDTTPPDWSASWGRFCDAFDIRLVPTTVLIGRDGKIADQGTLDFVLHKFDSLRAGR